MKQRPSAKPVISTANHEIPWILQNMKVHYLACPSTESN